MKAACLTIALLLLSQACKKPDNPANPQPSAVSHTGLIKSVRLTGGDKPRPDSVKVYSFSYDNSGLVDTMWISGDTGVYLTIVYERHPGYFIRRYHGPNQTPVSITDSFTTLADGRIARRYMFTDPAAGLDDSSTVQVSFEYSLSSKLTRWKTDFNEQGRDVYYQFSLFWQAGNVGSVEESSPWSISEITPWPLLFGPYAYDGTRPGQLAHPLSIYSLAEWGQYLVTCENALTGQGVGRYTSIQNIMLSGNQISSYVGNDGGRKTLYVFEYY